MVIGAGLIGSSVARIAHDRGRPGGDLAAEVVVTDSSPAVLARVAALGFADGVEADPARAVQGADCVMLCAPVGAFAGIAAAIAPHLRPGAILTDTGSTKVSVIRDVAPLLPAGVRFVPGHPMAGTEYPARTPASPRCSRAAGACCARCRTPTRRRSSRCPSCGAAWARWWSAWTPRTTTAWWPWSATCRT